MIRLINDKVYLTETDFKSMDGIWGAFRSRPEYCADLLALGNTKYDELVKLHGMHPAKIDSNIKRDSYAELFKKVFIDKNFELVNKDTVL